MAESKALSEQIGFKVVMKKTYWWRLGVICIGLIVAIYWYLAVNFDNLGFYNAYTKPFAFIAASLIFISPFLFFVRDTVFLKWMQFAGIWFGFTIFVIALAPKYGGGIFSMMNPTKESVSFTMSVLFLPVSLVWLLWDSKRSVE
ncbi:MAG: hypothetical protein WCL23_01690 [Candidatus Moraniibacteriota bacterium]